MNRLHRALRAPFLLPLRAAVALGDVLGRALPRRPMAGRPDPPPGISIIVPERSNPSLLAECLASLEVAAAQVDEPTEIVVVVDGSAREAYRRLQQQHPTVRWIFLRRSRGFAAAIRRGVAAAIHGWCYLCNNDMVAEPGALRALLPWRSPGVFAIGSQIFFRDPTRRREETGLGAMRVRDGLAELFDEAPDHPDTVRTALYAGGGSSLFQRALLKRYLGRRDPYAPFYWEDAEWGARAHADGLDVLFVPQSVAHHRHRATIGLHYSSAEIDRVFRRNGLLFQLRNLSVLGSRRAAFRQLKRAEWASLLQLCSPVRLLGLVCARIRLARAPFDDTLLEYATGGRIAVPQGDLATQRPSILIGSPFCVLPASHGGAVRIRGLCRELAARARVVLVSDEWRGYAGLGPEQLAPFSAVYTLGERPEPVRPAAARVARIESHSRPLLHALLRWRAALDRAQLVQVEYVELAGLARLGKLGLPWVLDLHDVLLSEGARTAEDGFEEELIALHDAVAVCSEEDAALLGPGRAQVVPNGGDRRPGEHRPSPLAPRMLFVASVRYPPNRRALEDFVREVLPAVRAQVPGAELHVLGDGLVDESLLRQPGVVAHGLVADPVVALDQAAVAVNPQRAVRGSSLKVVEALCAGRVCVSTREGARGFLHLNAPGLVTVETVPEMVQPLVRLLSDAAERWRIEQPQPELLERCSWRAAAASMLRVHQRALAGGAGSSQPRHALLPSAVPEADPAE